jgi:cation diffusion facilitator family transporter
MTSNKRKVSDTRVVGTSLLVSIFDVVLNLLVAIVTGSAVMIAQALQGMSDLISGGLLLLGVKRSKKAASPEYPFGYGREIFFWVLMAGLLMFLGTGGLSLYFGYRQFSHPTPVTDVHLAIIVLIIGLVSNGYAFSLSIRRLKQTHRNTKWWHELRHTSMVETKATLLIDFLGTAAAGLGFIAIVVFALTGNERLDGLGGMLIGTLMMVASAVLVWDVRDLIVGRAVEPLLAEKIIVTAKSVPGVRDVLDLSTMYLGSNRLLVIIEVHVEGGMDSNDIEVITDKVKQLVHDAVPQARHVQVEVESPSGKDM